MNRAAVPNLNLIFMSFPFQKKKKPTELVFRFPYIVIVHNCFAIKDSTTENSKGSECQC